MGTEMSVFDHLDPDQLEAVRLRANGAVSAGAGSGKTTVLAARYLDLVFSSGADVRSILCLTFTRKAQAEMQARVYRELSASTQALARAQVERFAEASISTIDAFCAQVLRSSAQDYGYAPTFEVDDEASRKLAEEEALRWLLARREDPVLAELFARLGFETTWKALFAEAAYSFAGPARRPEHDIQAMPGRAKASLEAARARAWAGLAATVEAARAALAEGEAHTAKGKAATAAFLGLAALLDGLEGKAPEAPGPEVRALAELNQAAYGKSPVEQALKEAAKAARAGAERLLQLEAAARTAPFEASVLAELAAFAEAYRRAKTEAGIMGFRDVATCAVDLLSRRTELRAWYKARYRYIMVDEFQDDDEVQKELLYLLAEDPRLAKPGIPGPADLAPDKLFFVGDDKQSIYRFRGADVAVFNRLGRELAPPVVETGARPAGGDQASLRLRTNYRSEPGLLAFFNSLFARVFAGATEDYEARFSEALARAASPGVSPQLRLLWKPRSAGQDGGLRSDDEALAKGIADFICAAVREGSLLLPDGQGGTRKAGYDDFAVLLRSTSKQYLLERFFRLSKLPYTATSLRGLFVESPANDIYAALRLALLPQDRFSYATVLRSPLCGISDDGMVLLLSSGLPAFDPQGAGLLGPGDRACLERAGQTYRVLREGVDRRPLADLVSYLWFEGGLRLSILRKPDAHPYLEHYDYLFHLAAKADAKAEGAASFLSALEPLMGKPEKLEDDSIQREAGQGIKLMSVHKSKGLEFPVVILPWIEGTGRKDGPGEAFYLSESAGITLNLRPWDDPDAKKSNVFFSEAKEAEAARQAAETKRLFYVACTRAETHLIFAAAEPRGTDHQGASFLALLTGGAEVPGEAGDFAALPAEIQVREVPALGEEEYLRLAGSAHRAAGEALDGAYGSATARELSFPRRSYPASILSRLSLGGPGAEEGEDLGAIPADSLQAPASLFGTACHALVEEGLAGRPLVLGDEILGKVDEAEEALFLSEARRLAQGFLDSAFAGKLRGLGSLGSEKGLILALPGGGRLVCRLDLLAESPTEAIVVDFKSDRRRVPGEYDGQLAAYRAACQALLPQKKVSTFLYWLRSGQAEEIAAEIGSGELESLLAEADRATGYTVPAPED